MKTRKTDIQFTDYLSHIDIIHRDTIIKLDQLIVEKFGEDNRFIWEGIFWGGTNQRIIGYGELDMKRKDGATWFSVGLAIQKNYYSLYINAVEDNMYLAKKYADTLGKVKIGSSSISFTTLDKLNLETLATLLEIAHKQWKSSL